MFVKWNQIQTFASLDAIHVINTLSLNDLFRYGVPQHLMPKLQAASSCWQEIWWVCLLFLKILNLDSDIFQEKKQNKHSKLMNRKVTNIVTHALTFPNLCKTACKYKSM